MQTTTATSTVAPVISGLNKFLADSYALMSQAQLAHWNVVGENFFQLHAAFQALYEDMFEAVDEIAERVRALDAYAPGGLKGLAEISAITEMATGPAPAKDFVAHLVDCQETVLESAFELRRASEEAGDLETQDLVIGRIQAHQKNLWMLKSFLKNL